jgi:hypothetical protein
MFYYIKPFFYQFNNKYLYIILFIYKSKITELLTDLGQELENHQRLCQMFLFFVHQNGTIVLFYVSSFLLSVPLYRQVYREIAQPFGRFLL